MEDAEGLRRGLSPKRCLQAAGREAASVGMKTLRIVENRACLLGVASLLEGEMHLVVGMKTLRIVENRACLLGGRHSLREKCILSLIILRSGFRRFRI